MPEQPPPPANSQQTQAHAGAAPTVFDAVDVSPLTVPDSPLPESPLVPCHIVADNWKPSNGVAATAIVPCATQEVCVAALLPVLPSTLTLHHDR